MRNDNGFDWVFGHSLDTWYTRKIYFSVSKLNNLQRRHLSYFYNSINPSCRERWPQHQLSSLQALKSLFYNSVNTYCIKWTSANSIQRGCIWLSKIRRILKFWKMTTHFFNSARHHFPSALLFYTRSFCHAIL